MAEHSTRHSPRIDDEMAAETSSLTHGAPVEAHAEEWLMSEPPGDGEPMPEAVIEFAADPATGALDDNERRRRSELAASLPPHAFPGDRGALLKAAERDNAEPWVLELLARLPIDTRFDTVQDVWSELGGHREARAGEPPSDAAPSSDAAPAPEPAAAREADGGASLVQQARGFAAAGVGLAISATGAVLRVARGLLGRLPRR